MAATGRWQVQEWSLSRAPVWACQRYRHHVPALHTPHTATLGNPICCQAKSQANIAGRRHYSAGTIEGPDHYWMDGIISRRLWCFERAVNVPHSSIKTTYPSWDELRGRISLEEMPRGGHTKNTVPLPRSKAPTDHLRVYRSSSPSPAAVICSTGSVQHLDPTQETCATVAHHANHTGPIRQHDLDHTDHTRSGIDLSASKYL